MNITEFKKGDIITRVEKAITGYKEIGWSICSNEPEYSYRLVGIEVEVIGIANGNIYLKYCKDEHSHKKGEFFNILLDIFKDGWGYYVDLNTIINRSELVIDNTTKQ